MGLPVDSSTLKATEPCCGAWVTMTEKSSLLVSMPSETSMPTWVPRMPMVATGVSSTMASGSVLAICPLTKVKTPSTTDIEMEPSWVPGS